MAMGKCAGWTSMCNANKKQLPTFCNPQFNTTTTQCNAGSMKMFFHGGLHDMVLFKSWYACNVGQYLVVLFVTFAVSFLSSVFRSQRKKVNQFLYRTLCFRCTTTGKMRVGSPVPAHIGSPLLVQEDPMYTVTLSIDGMTCGACVNTVRTAILTGSAQNRSVVHSVTVQLDHGGSAQLTLQGGEPGLFAWHISHAVENVEAVGFAVRGTTEPALLVKNQRKQNQAAAVAKNPYPQNAVKALTTGLQLTVDYALMLAAMTFNTGVFFAVVLGYSTSTLLLGHVKSTGGGSARIDQSAEEDDDNLPECCRAGHGT